MVAGHAPMELECSPFDGFYSGGHLMPPSVMDRAGISSDGYEKSASHFELAGCLGVLSLEMVGTGLGLNQFEAHFDSSLSLMVLSPGDYSGPSSFTPMSVFEGSLSPVGALGCTKLVQKMILRLSTDRKSFVSSNLVSGGLVSVDTRIVLLEFVPRLVGPPFPEVSVEFLRVG